ncbi:hypothetical protein HS088_TW03G01069 [Tripterygium wilfordii]|uniref:High mobility group B protein 6 n=1 Tax=Tripterygium wilfordii TaxID=458696 RepID=A0A7J7DWH6_TRIWF|nr:high mobility group B protein 6-like [Tripterygium wilfordii]KAF5750730.1 hypothetical protein HS088_TW03G01069 [Tripterygium wilfordii]
MPTVQSPIMPKSGRKPLQPKNIPANQVTEIRIANPDQQKWIEIRLVGDSDKENRPVHTTCTPSKISSMEPLEASLAEELGEVKKKLERLRWDKERTEKMLKERDRVLDMQMKELQSRGEIQKNLEIEVDRLYRLNELKSYCMRISPIRTLREKEREKKDCEVAQLEEQKSVDAEESIDEEMSVCSSSATPQLAIRNR